MAATGQRSLGLTRIPGPTWLTGTFAGAGELAVPAGPHLPADPDVPVLPPGHAPA